MKILRLSDGLAVVPEFIASVRIEPAMDLVPCRQGQVKVDGSKVTVVHLLGEPIPAAYFGGAIRHGTTDWSYDGGYWDETAYQAALAEAEARARVVYETILEAIRQEQ